MKWHTEVRKVSELKNWESNPRNISEENFEELVSSIDDLGNFEPLVIDTDGTVIAGNQRLRVATKLGESEVEVSVPERKLTEQEIKKIGLISNRHSGEWDMDKLANEFEDVLEELGFDDLMPEVELDVKEDDYEEPEDLPIKVKLGEVWQLGKHRLMCGDSTKIEDVEKLMNGQKADMVFTDPPYGMSLDTDYSKLNSDPKFVEGKNLKSKQGNKYNSVIGDHEDFNPDFINTVFAMFGYCKEIILWGADYYSELIQNRNEGSWFVWDKRNENENLDKMFGSCFELCWSKAKHKRQLVRVQWAGVFGTKKEFDHKRHHPTQKPIELSSWFITKYSEENSKVIDLFGGSGSTLIACEQTNRVCYMMELDEHYCTVILDRWEKLTGEKGIKLED